MPFVSSTTVDFPSNPDSSIETFWQTVPNLPHIPENKIKVMWEAVTRRCSVKKGTVKKCLKTHKKSRYNEIPFDKGCRAGPLEFSN